eukprot:TRINITY_DN3927_c0_g1_i2.p1 TRINITY_DN3927_c0_g1~~TRINITY_DN3927_c0_g1_i2.p1  ORF type:complete len:206 (-),score=24.22 TRINITY_DN3927_c0_g1_i2:118-693(-)
MAPHQHQAFVPCSKLHPFIHSCSMLMADQWLVTFKQGLKMYAPLFIIPAVLLRRRHIKYLVTRTLPEIIRSSAFLGTFASSYARFYCLFRNALKKDLPIGSVIAGFLAGLASIFIERKSRRSELALYCLNQSIEVVWRMMEARGLVRSRNNGEVFIFMLASSIMFYFFQNEPSAVRSNMHGVYKFLLGGKN